MATTQSQPSPVRTPTPIASTQPGGGFFMELELAWGRWRRRWLRRFRPGYVQDMLGRRQGACPGCPHDVVDPRDLKFYRNVCGYWFRDEDDRFRWRGRLRLARAGLAELLGFSALFLALTAAVVALGWLHVAYWGLLPLIAALWLFVVSFFRDPERTVPTEAGVLVSPADGTITDVGEVEEPEFPDGRALRVGMFLSIFNVHVNRIPCDGKVIALRYFPGSFLDARSLDCRVRNEQFWIDLEEAGTGRRIRVKQIAGAVARRIVCWLKPAEEVRRGERLGMIKFGSRTEVSIPIGEAAEVLVKVGDQVKGGSTVLLRLKPATGKNR